MINALVTCINIIIAIFSSFLFVSSLFWIHDVMSAYHYLYIISLLHTENVARGGKLRVYKM